MSRSYSTDSANYTAEVDQKLIQSLNQLKTQVLEKMHQHKNNLFTFMKAAPIVFIKKDKDGQERRPVLDKYRSTYQFVREVKKRLTKAKDSL